MHAGLGKWLDMTLQKVIQHLPFTLSSSFELVRDLRTIQKVDPTEILFTMDAISMYTNIETPHVLSVINKFLATSKPRNTPLFEICST